MIRDIVSLIKYRKKNLYPIGVMYLDDFEANAAMQNALKYLTDEGMCVRSLIIQGAIFGYVLCERKEIDGIIAKYNGNNEFCISRDPVNFFMKNIILG